MAGQPVKTSPSRTSTQMWVRCCKVGTGATCSSHDDDHGGAVQRLDAQAVRSWAHAALAALAGSRDRIDAVNVIPVPDSDTGTNVLLTVTGGVEALDVGPADRPAGRPGHHAPVRPRRDALGARQLRDHRQPVPDRVRAGSAAQPDSVDVAQCLAAAARAARGSMQEPQEGTILTLADEVARSAATAPTRARTWRRCSVRSSPTRTRRSPRSAPSTPCCVLRTSSTPGRARCS